MCDFCAKNNITISNVSQPQRLMSGSHTAGSQLRPRVESSSYGVEERRMKWTIIIATQVRNMNIGPPQYPGLVLLISCFGGQDLCLFPVDEYRGTNTVSMSIFVSMWYRTMKSWCEQLVAFIHPHSWMLLFLFQKMEILRHCCGNGSEKRSGSTSLSTILPRFAL